MRILLLTSFLSSFLSRVYSDLCSTPAREGYSYNFRRTVRLPPATDALYLVYGSEHLRTVSSCPFSEKFCDNRDAKSNVSVTTVADVKTAVLSTTINPVRRKYETTWRWRDGSKNELSECQLKVYYVNTSPMCGPIDFNSDEIKTQLMWKCSMSKMYPEPLCLFKYKISGDTDFTNTVPSGYVTTTTEIATGDPSDPVYYSGNCTMNLPLNTLGPGVHTFKVLMYPNVPGGTEDLGTTSDSAPMDLKLPVPKLKDCPKGGVQKDGYIKAGTTATCQCTLIDKGHPPGTPLWWNSNNKVAVQGDSLNVSYNKDDPNLPYKCVGKSVLKAPAEGPHVISYSPNFAYGPTTVSISFNGRTDKFNFCTSIGFEMYCDIPTGNVNTPVNKEVLGNAVIKAMDFKVAFGALRHRYSVIPRGGGILNLTCVVSNKIFPDLTANQTKSITIQTPPSPPVMTVNGQTVPTGGDVSVVAGDSLNIRCSVSGGYPAVTQVTISCGDDDRKVDNGSLVTRTFDKTMNGKKCVCTAQHDTACSVKETEFTLDVQYGPKHVSIGLSKNIDTFIACGTDASFEMYCDTEIDEVNPEPQSKVEGNANTAFVNMEQHLGYYRFFYTIIPSVGGILPLKCVVFNPDIDKLKAEQDKNITIQTPPTSPPVMTVNGNTVTTGVVLTVTSGDSLEVKCSVSGGYPDVSQVTISCDGIVGEVDKTQASKTLIVNKDMNGDKCVCTAQHVTECYDKETEFTLDVQYSPTLSSFEANDQPSRLDVNVGDRVKFSCEAEGNPRPAVSAKGLRLNRVLNLQDQANGDYTMNSMTDKVMGCKDTDTYVCTAVSGVGGAVSKNLSVFVSCTPEFPEPPEKTEYKQTNASDLVIIVNIIGHPIPTDFTLIKTGNGGTRMKRSVTETELDKNSYNVTFLAGVPPEGTVMLRMFGLLDEDSGEYNLTIMNGIGEGLKYSFYVTIVSAESGDDSTSMGLVIGAAVGAVVVIIIVIVLLVLRRKGLPPFRKADPRRKMREREEAEEQMESHNMNDIYGGMPGKKGGVSNNLDPDAVAVRLRESNIVVTRDQPARYDPTLRDSNLGQFDNVIYNGDIDTEVEMIPNEIYGMDRKAYTDYNEVKTTMTSAMAVPKNLKTLSGSPPPYDDNDNPYEDFKENDTSKLQTQPPSHSKPTALKPSVPNKPKPSKNKKPPNDNAKVAVEQQPQNTFGLAGNEESVYSEVVKKPAGKPLIPKAVVVDKADDLDDLGLPDQAKAPSVPVKNFEKPAKPQVPSKPGHKTSDKNDAPASNNHGYTNLGMDYNEGDTVPEDDNVYGNSGVR